MATKRGGDPTDPTTGTSARKSAGAGGGAGGKSSSRGAAKPNGPASPTAETGGTRRGAAAKATTARTTGGTRAAAGGKPAAGGKTAAGAKATTGAKTAEGAKAGTGGKGTTRGAAKTAGSTARKAGGKKPDLKKDLREFASTRPQGWSHDDWLRFLDDLQARGHNINDRDQIGSLLEKERLSLALERIPGLSAPRARTIAERYGYLWRLKETDADQLSSEAKIPRPVAEKVLEGLRS